MTDTLDPTLEPAADEMGALIGAFAERIFLAALGSFELATIELGHRLGLYRALGEGPATPPELAARAGIDARYAREWLEQQATAALVAVDADPVNGDPDFRVFSLPAVQQACLLDPESLAYLMPLAGLAVAGPPFVAELVDAYRTGSGISFGGYGDAIRGLQEAANRPQFVNLLASESIPALPDVAAKLRGGPASVADIACGCGWSSIAIARAFEGVTVDGYDLDADSIVDAQANALATGVSDRVSFEVRDAADAPEGTYDLVCCFESLHDMAHPVEALAAMRAMVADGGAVLIVDERAADAFTADDPDPTQRYFYAASVLHCLPVGRSQEGSAATGTLLRTATLETYAADAGFASVEVLPIDHDMLRFYRLR